MKYYAIPSGFNHPVEVQLTEIQKRIMMDILLDIPEVDIDIFAKRQLGTSTGICFGVMRHFKKLSDKDVYIFCNNFASCYYILSIMERNFKLNGIKYELHGANQIEFANRINLHVFPVSKIHMLRYGIEKESLIICDQFKYFHIREQECIKRLPNKKFLISTADNFSVMNNQEFRVTYKQNCIDQLS